MVFSVIIIIAFFCQQPARPAFPPGTGRQTQWQEQRHASTWQLLIILQKPARKSPLLALPTRQILCGPRQADKTRGLTAPPQGCFFLCLQVKALKAVEIRTGKTTHYGAITMFSFLKKDPAKKLQKTYEVKLEQAMRAQRNGDIKSYSLITAEAEGIRQEIQNLERAKRHDGYTV